MGHESNLRDHSNNDRGFRTGLHDFGKSQRKATRDCWIPRAVDRAQDDGTYADETAGGRYGRQSSIIASSMKGEGVVRPPNLVLLATTSLYGVGSSQYNRVRIPLEDVGGKAGAKLEYAELGMSKGYGSYHFGRASVDYLETLVPRGGDSRKVNSIFGEGSIR